MSSTQACWRSLAYCSRFDEPLVASQRRFTFEQQRKPFGVAEACGVAAGFDVGEGLGHAVKAECVELIEGRMGEQGVIS